MNTILRKSETAAKSVLTTGRTVTLVLASGKEVVLPVEKYPRLANATPAQLAEVRLRRGGEALRWDQLDEDILVASVVLGRWPTRGGFRPGAGRKPGNTKPVTARLGQKELMKLTREAIREKISKASIFNDAINIRDAVASIATGTIHNKGATFDFTTYRSLAGLRKHGYGGFRIQLLKNKPKGTMRKISDVSPVSSSASKLFDPVAHFTSGHKAIGPRTKLPV
jgi:Protein of unknown function (DUF2442)